MNAVFDGVLEMLPNVCRMQEGFGGNTAYMEAGPPQFGVILFDDTTATFQAMLASARIAAEYPQGPLPRTITSYVMFFF